jgi:predicted ferric reductase
MRGAFIILFLAGVVIPATLTYLAVAPDVLPNHLAMACGVVAYCLMSLNLFLATRPIIIEKWIGGLDQLYFSHKWIGISVFVLIFGHKFIGIDIEGLELTRDTSRIAKEVAEFTFPILVVLLLLSIAKRIPKLQYEIPYQYWRISHRLIGIVFLAFTFHQFFIKSPIEDASILYYYLQFAALVGVLSFMYTQLFVLFRRRKYEITSVDILPAATIIEAKPKSNRIIKTQPGNFAFISISRKGLGEPHPFTISQSREDGTLQFCIRGLGDFTKKIRDTVKTGDPISVEGGYGRFDFRRSKNDQIWVAGGIGITPFLAFADSLTDDCARRIHLYYCVKKEEEAVGLERLKAAAARFSKFDYTLFISERDGRFSSENIISNSNVDPANSTFWFCGPSPMRKSILSGLKKAGRKPLGVHYEKFEFR